jgi:Leucine-rich repeat (LRR) protein
LPLHLVELVVDDNGLTTLPDLRACAKLSRVSCGRCRLSQLPAWLGACARLVELDASSNKIASPLPSLRGCRSLKTLQLRRNAIRELPRLPSGLTRLLASGNNLDGIATVTDCSDLVELDLERNKLVGLPDDLADLHRLEIINVSKNLLRSIEVGGCTS